MQRKFWNSAGVKLFKLDLEKVLNYLQSYAEKIVSEKKEVLAVILIGSLARGDYTAFSDADIVIIVNESSHKKPHDRVIEYIDQNAPIDIEPRVYTLDEIIRMAREKRKVVQEIIKYGKQLAGKLDIVDQLRQIYMHC